MYLDALHLRRSRMPLREGTTAFANKDLVPVTPADLRCLACVHHEDHAVADALLRAADALACGARCAAGMYFDLAAALLGIEHHTEPTTFPGWR